MSETASTLTTSTPRKMRAFRRWVLTMVAIFFALLLHWLFVQSQPIVPGVIVRPVGPCDVDWFEKWGGAMVVACPHTDLIKVWPLPVQQPWYQDPFFPSVTAMHG